MKKEEFFNLILGIPKSIYFNIKIFGISAGKTLPVLISNKTRIKNITKGCIEIPNDCRFGTIKIGINNGPFERGNKKETYINIDSGKIKFKGKANIASDSVLNIQNGICTFGNNFCANYGLICSCENKIDIGNNVLIGWNCTIIDGDGHSIVDNYSKKIINKSKPIIIEDYVWIGARSTLLKGTVIKENSVVALESIINKVYDEGNVILAGKPASIVRRDIHWRR